MKAPSFRAELSIYRLRRELRHMLLKNRRRRSLAGPECARHRGIAPLVGQCLAGEKDGILERLGESPASRNRSDTAIAVGAAGEGIAGPIIGIGRPKPGSEASGRHTEDAGSRPERGRHHLFDSEPRHASRSPPADPAGKKGSSRRGAGPPNGEWLIS